MEPATRVARVTGIAGVYLRATQPEALRHWYAEVLGFDLDPSDASAAFGGEDVGESVTWAVFDQHSTYLGDPNIQQAMVSYRVDDLDGVLESLRAEGHHTEPVYEQPDGRRSWGVDPEGNRFELWEKAAAAPPDPATLPVSPRPTG
ncbi:MAG: VOC family protein [Acidimicrobiales bacterium]